MLTCVSESRADWIRSFAGSDSERSAEVEFFYKAGTDELVVELTNTDVDLPLGAGPGDNLTAVFFSADFALSAASGSAYVPSIGSIIATNASGNVLPWSTWPSPGPPARSVGTEWAYKNGLVGAPLGATQGLSSAGLFLFGPEDRFETGYDDDVLLKPASPDGENLGIVPAGTTKVSGSLKKQLLICNSVRFTFAGVGDLSGAADSIDKVAFLYGTALDGPTVVPEPSALILLGIGVIVLLVRSWRRSRS